MKMNYDDYVHIDEDRDNQLYEAVCQKEDKERSFYRTVEELSAPLKWRDLYEEAVVAFEDGHPQKLINLEKSLGIAWKEPT